MAGVLVRGLLTAAVLAAVGLGLAPADTSGQASAAFETPRGEAPAVRGLWVWQDVPAAQMVAFARATQTNRLWLATSSDASRREARNLRRTLALAAPSPEHPRPIRVAALGGSPRWAVHPRWALAWAEGTQRTTPLVDLHVDVEPHALDAWDTKRKDLLRGYLRMLDLLHDLPGSLSVDIPFWYPGMKVDGRGLATQVARRVDHVTVMSYRDHAAGSNSVLSISAAWLRVGDRTGTPVTLGLETTPSDECTYCTFWEEGAAALAAERAVVQARAAAGHRSFAGTAVHDWNSWRALRDR